MIRSHILTAAVIASALFATGCDEKKAEPAKAPAAPAAAVPARAPVEGTVARGEGTAAEAPAAAAAAPANAAELVAQGEKLYTSLGCNACHSTDGSMRVGPTFAELHGSKVTLADGAEVVADDAYLRTSILDPTKQVVKGYVPTMPPFKGRVGDAELQALVEYIKTLK